MTLFGRTNAYAVWRGALISVATEVNMLHQASRHPC